MMWWGCHNIHIKLFSFSEGTLEYFQLVIIFSPKYLNKISIKFMGKISYQKSVCCPADLIGNHAFPQFPIWALIINYAGVLCLTSLDKYITLLFL